MNAQKSPFSGKRQIERRIRGDSAPKRSEPPSRENPRFLLHLRKTTLQHGEQNLPNIRHPLPDCLGRHGLVQRLAARRRRKPRRRARPHRLGLDDSRTAARTHPQMPRGDRPPLRRQRTAHVPLRRRAHTGHHRRTGPRGLHLGGKSGHLDLAAARCRVQGRPCGLELAICPQKRGCGGRCRRSRGLRGGRPQRTRGELDDGPHPAGARGGDAPPHRGRRHRYGQRHAGCLRTGRRGRSDGDALCSQRREFGQRGVQTALHHAAGGRYDARTQAAEPHTAYPQRLLPPHGGSRGARSLGRRAARADRLRSDTTGHLEGDLEEGELEIGQIASLIRDLPSAGEIVASLVEEFNARRAALPTL